MTHDELVTYMLAIAKLVQSLANLTIDGRPGRMLPLIEEYLENLNSLIEKLPDKERELYETGLFVM